MTGEGLAAGAVIGGALAAVWLFPGAALAIGAGAVLVLAAWGAVDMLRGD
jgi:hypothetical protein